MTRLSHLKKIDTAWKVTKFYISFFDIDQHRNQAHLKGRYLCNVNKNLLVSIPDTWTGRLRQPETPGVSQHRCFPTLLLSCHTLLLSQHQRKVDTGNTKGNSNCGALFQTTSNISAQYI